MATTPNTTATTRVHNLIILDESGSMGAIYQPALTGVNETLQTIRQAQIDNPNQQHYVTLVAFDSGHYNRIYHNRPAAQTVDITDKQYRPCGGTPLYDAIGRGINELRPAVLDGDVALVTIITDGYENSSREYNAAMIKELIEQLTKQEWVFTYIGSNQDVNAVADSMSIKHRMSWVSSCEGTHQMFAKERVARGRLFSKLNDGESRKNINTDDYFAD